MVITISCDPDSPLAPGQPTNGEGTPIPCSVFSCSPCVTVGGTGCALHDGLKLKLNLTVLEIEVDRVEIFHPVKCGVGSSGNCSLDRVYTWALSQSSLCLMVMLDARAF